MADDFSQIAKDFIDRANGGTGPTGTWRLEVLQKRFSSNVGREIPIRIRRFLKGIPWAQVHDAIRYLISQAPYEGIIYNGVELKGKYRPTLTQWRRDDQEQVGGNAQGSYTLVQDLIEVTDGDKLDTVSADSCSETEMTKWVWDAPEIEKLPELPYDGSQGVTYAIRQVRRNEDGTFDYAIVRQVAKTKISGWIVTECDKYSRVSVKVFDNVYGGLFDGDPFTDGTSVLRIPAPCETNNGTLVQVSVAQNPDCTFRVTVQKTEAKPNVEKTSETRKGLRGVVTSETTVATNPLPETGLELGEQVRNERRPDGLYDVTHVKVSKENVGDIGSSCERTVFEHQHAETRNEAVRPEDEADFAGGGKTYQVQSRATEEGTWDVTRTETTEIERKGAQKSKQKTLRGVTETTVDRNVNNDDVTVTNIGDRVSVEMTPGGKYNRTVTKVSKESVGDIGSSCETTVFEHRHVESENVASRPEKEASSAGGGKTYQVQSRATEEGTWDVIRTTVEEAKDVMAQHVMRKTLRGVTETTVTRSTSDSSVSVSEIGDEVRVEQTPGGLWNRTEIHASHEAVGVIGKSCSSTPVVHTDTVLSNVPDGRQPEPQHQVAEVNVEKSVEVRRTEEGTWDVTNRTTVHQPWGEQKIATADNSSQTVEIHAFQNLTSVPPMTVGEGQMITASASRNNVGSFDGNFRIVTGKAWGEQTIATAENESQKTEIHAFQNLTSAPQMTAGQGQSISASASRNELGLFDGNFRIVTGKAWGEQTIATATSPARTLEIHAFQNLQSVPSMTASVGEDISANAHRNELGLFDGGYTKTVYKTVSAMSTSSTAVDIVTTRVVHNSKDSSPTASRGEAHATPDDHGTYSTTVSEHNPQPVSIGPITWSSTVKSPHSTLTYEHSLYVFRNLSVPPTPSEAGEVSLSVSVNNFGLVDGHMTTKKLVDWSVNGSGGGQSSQSSFSYYRYTFVNGVQYKQKVHGTTYTVGNGPSASMIGDRQVSGGGVTQAYVCDPWEPV